MHKTERILKMKENKNGTKRLFSALMSAAIGISVIAAAAPAAFADEGLTEKDGWYILKTESDLEAFREKVNGGENEIKGKLEASVELTNDWTPIGTNDHPFNGEFSGEGFTVSGIKADDGASDIPSGLFGYVGESGKVSNLNASGDVTGVDEFTAVIAGSNAGTIEKCVVSGSKLSLGDFDNFGAIAGSNSGTINNCAVINTAFTRTDSEKAVGAIAGNNSGTIKNSFSYAVTATGVKENAFAPIAVNAEKGTVSNSYYFTEVKLGETAGTSATEEEFASGEVAFNLRDNSSGKVWGQEIGKDKYPVSYSGKNFVYRVQFINGTAVHSEQYVTEGTNAKEPSKPESKDKVFKNWSGSFENVREDLIIKAVFASEEVEVEEPTEEKPDKEEEVTVDDNKDKDDDKNPSTGAAVMLAPIVMAVSAAVITRRKNR